MEITVGDKVRVHYHPPGARTSFVEGVVSRVDVITLRGRVFVVDVTCEVVLNREQPIRSGYQNYVLYERWEEFPGRIEVLSRKQETSEALSKRGFEPDAMGVSKQGLEATHVPAQEPMAEHEPDRMSEREAKPDMMTSGETQPESVLKAGAKFDSLPVEVEGQDAPMRTR